VSSTFAISLKKEKQKKNKWKYFLKNSIEGDITNEFDKRKKLLLSYQRDIKTDVDARFLNREICF